MPEEIQGGTPAPDANVVAEAAPNAAPQVETTEVKTGEETPPVEKTFTQKELDAILEKKTAKLIRQREQERGRAQAYEQQLAKAQPPQVGAKPQLSQFNNEDDFIEAAAKWKQDQTNAQRQTQEAVMHESQFASKVTDFRDELSELVDLSKFDKLTISTAMAHAILDSDMSTKLGAHLVANPDEATRIANLSPARQAAEIGKLEATLSTAKSKSISNAPAPIKPIGAGGATDSGLRDDLPIEEWMRRRNKERSR